MRRYSPQYYSPPRRGYGGRARSPPRRGHGGRREQNNGSLLVRNVPLTCSGADLRGPFERFGPVRDVYLPKDYYTGEPRGFAFVQFVDPYDAAEAQYHMNRSVLGGREITVVLAAETRKRPEEMRSRARVRGPSAGYGDGRRSSHYRRSRSRSVSRSRSPPRYPSGSRSRYRSRSYSPAPRRREEYSASPPARGREVERSRDEAPRRRSYTPGYDEAGRNDDGYAQKPSYDDDEEDAGNGRADWKSPGRAASGSPPGSRSRSRSADSR